MYNIVVIVTQIESRTCLSKLNAQIMRLGLIHIATDNNELNYIESRSLGSRSQMDTYVSPITTVYCQYNVYQCRPY